MNQLTIRTRMLVSFGIILLVMALMGGVAHNRLSAIDRNVGVMKTDALPGLRYSTALLATWNELHILSWQTLTAGSEAERRRYFDQRQEARQRLDAQERDYETTIFRDEDRKRFDAYKEVRANYDRAAGLFGKPAASPGV